jgi:hypothetical protein
MSTHLYTHPYKRGFHVILDREGPVRLSLLLWRWEWTTRLLAARMSDDIIWQRNQALEKEVAALRAELTRRDV